MRVGSLFSGIGGFDLGLERAGFTTAWFCEADEFCQRVLAHHWPAVPCYPDIKELRGDEVEPVDVLCGGFPCQDLSVAGKQAGIEGARSGLWSEYARLVGELRPRYVVVENVAALRYKRRGFGRVLGDLASLGYDTEWHCIPACAVGAPHERDRIWLIAYPAVPGHAHPLVADPERLGSAGRGASGDLASPPGTSQGDSEERQRCGDAPDDRGPDGARRTLGDLNGPGLEGHRGPVASSADHPWAAEPDVGRVAHGVPARVDRLRALGNALVPQIAEWIGHRIVAHEEAR